MNVNQGVDVKVIVLVYISYSNFDLNNLPRYPPFVYWNRRSNESLETIFQSVEHGRAKLVALKSLANPYPKFGEASEIFIWLLEAIGYVCLYRILIPDILQYNNRVTFFNN